MVTHLVLHVEQIRSRAGYSLTWVGYEAIYDTHTITDAICGVDKMELWVNIYTTVVAPRLTRREIIDFCTRYISLSESIYSTRSADGFCCTVSISCSLNGDYQASCIYNLNGIVLLFQQRALSRKPRYPLQTLFRVYIALQYTAVLVL